MPQKVLEQKTAKWFEVRKQEDQYETGVEYYAKAYSIQDVINQVKREYVPKHYRSQFNRSGNWSDEDSFDAYYCIGKASKYGDRFTISFSIQAIEEDMMLPVHRRRDFTS